MSEEREHSKTTRKHLEKPRNELRRKERAMSDETWLQDLLQRGAFGTLATSYRDQPFLTPLLFVYKEEEKSVFFHGAKVGRIRANIENNPNVCFNVSEFGQILPAEMAVDFSLEYNSVTVFGKAAVVIDPVKAEAVLQLLMDKYAPQLKVGQDYIPARPEDLKRTAVYQIKIEEWSGKRHDKEDYENPYDYPSPPIIQS
jgi:nitroimidazol reductase NimA-like FMN-containing flavoprotein (pyridoxamine 5'-phosphate oxidase superfamily)